MSASCTAQTLGGGGSGSGYVVQCTGGTINGANFTPTTSPNPGDPGSTTGTVTQYASATNGQAGSCKITASDGGAVTGTITWNGGSANTPAPPAAVVVETSVATGGGTVGDSPPFTFPADPTAGFGSGVTPVQTMDGHGNTVWTGTRYSAATSGSSSTTTCSPNFVLSGTTGVNTDSYESLNLTYTYTATAVPITMKLNGTTPDSSGNLNILIGQGCKASLSGIPSELLNNTANPPTYSWTISGTTFQSWSPTTPFIQRVQHANPNASYEVDGPGPLTNATAPWYWNEAATTETVKCTVMLTPPSGQGSAFSVIVTQNVLVAEPIYNCTHFEGVPFVNQAGTSLQATPTDNKNGHGETWFCNVQTPTLFGSGGLCNFSQIITPGRSHTYATGTVPCTENTKTGLDTIYPYPAEGGDPYNGSGTNAGWPADNSKHRSGDSPETSTQDEYGTRGVAMSISIGEKFYTYLMYQPPGTDVQFVPLHEIDWNWNAAPTKPSGGWASTDGIKVGSVTSTNSARDYTYPQWTILEGSGVVGTGW